MSDLDYTILQKWHEWLSKNANIGVDLIGEYIIPVLIFNVLPPKFFF